jgi:hypothetical protein
MSLIKENEDEILRLLNSEDKTNLKLAISIAGIDNLVDFFIEKLKSSERVGLYQDKNSYYGKFKRSSNPTIYVTKYNLGKLIIKSVEIVGSESINYSLTKTDNTRWSLFEGINKEGFKKALEEYYNDL